MICLILQHLREVQTTSKETKIIISAASRGHHFLSLNKINAKQIHRSDGRGEIMKTALTIAGSDSCGGAGIQADIKTMTAHGVYAMSAITALTAQNTTGVTGIMEVTPEFLAAQLDAVLSDIFPDAVKIGMVSSAGLIKIIAEKLETYRVKNIVIDPVMVATSGSRLISEDAVDALKEKLFPLAALLTPNIPEAEVLSGIEIKTTDDMITAAGRISNQYGVAVLCKGGHRINDANDLLYNAGSFQWFIGQRIENPNTHGTGCTLSSAIASNLAKGYDIMIAIEKSKVYLSGALEAMLDLGNGSGPLNHAFGIKGECWEVEL
jgi:hydroxymethylpyrimidine/phosphomethylpyrimidine kinase